MTAACTGAVHKAPDAGGSCPCGLVTKVVATPKRGGVSGEREELAAALWRIAAGPDAPSLGNTSEPSQKVMRADADSLWPVVDRLANQRAAAELRKAADWIWDDLPASASASAELHARADALDPT